MPNVENNRSMRGTRLFPWTYIEHIAKEEYIYLGFNISPVFYDTVVCYSVRSMFWWMLLVVNV